MTSSNESYLQELLAERDADVGYRRQSGIEECWARARAQFAYGDSEKVVGTHWEKSNTLDGSLTRGYTTPDGDSRSTVSVNITRPYTIAGSARAIDLSHPAGERDNWDLRETPISDLQMLKPYFEGRTDLLSMAPQKFATLLQQDEEARKAAILRCRQLIKDYLIETNFSAKSRRQVREAWLVGTGVLYGPFPEQRKLKPEVKAAVDLLVAMADPLDQPRLKFELEMKVLRRPAFDIVPVENIYPDKRCGASIHNGDHIWQVVPDLSKQQIRALRGSPGYFVEELEEILTQEPKPVASVGGEKLKLFEIWRRTGEVNLTKLVESEEEFGELRSQMGLKPTAYDEACDCFETLQLEFINDHLVKINALPTDSTALPYMFLLCEEVADSPFGIGIPEQIETPQRGLNMAVRAAQDNLGYSVGFGLVYLEGVIVPMDGEDTQYRPYKVYRAQRDQLMALAGKEVNPKDAIQTLEFPNHLGSILPWIQYWLQMAEQTTGLPLILQGQKSSDSVGVTNALMGSSTTNLRLFIKHWDDDVCKRVITSLYDWVQLYGPPETQADAVAQPLGSSILVEKELQQQALMQLLNLAVQPAFGLSPETLARRQVEGFGLSYDDVKLTDEERQRLEMAAQQPEAVVQVAQLRSQTDLQVQQMKNQLAEMKMMLEAQLKGASLEQAREAVQTQGMANIAQEAVRQEGAKDMATLGAALDPTNPVIGLAPGKVEGAGTGIGPRQPLGPSGPPVVPPPTTPGASRESPPQITDEELDALGL